MRPRRNRRGRFETYPYTCRICCVAGYSRTALLIERQVADIPMTRAAVLPMMARR